MYFKYVYSSFRLGLRLRLTHLPPHRRPHSSSTQVHAHRQPDCALGASGTVLHGCAVIPEKRRARSDRPRPQLSARCT
jgi:hypothetical protein